MAEDRNFDDLADRFRRNIYGSLKGRIRLNVLERDFREHIPEYFQDSHGRRVLDVAAGEALFSAQLATYGCKLVLNDLSTQMLTYAEAEIARLNVTHPGLAERVDIVHGPAQHLAETLSERHLPGTYDLVLCHALIEWMAQPETLVPCLSQLIQPGGYLSLTCYNINGLAFKNLLRTNFRKFDINNFKPAKGSLTPTHPQNPLKVQAQLQTQGFEVIARSGIRVFHDYIFNPDQRDRDQEGLVARELEYSRRESFWQMARYVHFLCRYRGD